MGSQVRLRVVEPGSLLRFVKKMMCGCIHVLLMYQSSDGVRNLMISLLSSHH